MRQNKVKLYINIYTQMPAEICTATYIVLAAPINVGILKIAEVKRICLPYLMYCGFSSIHKSLNITITVYNH